MPSISRSTRDERRAGEDRPRKANPMAQRSSFPHSGPVQYSPTEVVSPDRSQAEAMLRQIPGVEGVGEGRDAIGDPAWLVYVKDKSVASRLPAEVNGRRVLSE